MGAGRRSCHVTIWGKRWRGVHEGHFQVRCGMVVRGGRRQSMCHPALHISQREHFMFVKRTLSCLAVNITWWRRGQDSGGEGGRGEDRGLSNFEGESEIELSK